MDPLRIAIRCLVVFLYLLVVVRLSGKRVVSEGTAFDLVLGLILGDLVDDAIFSEVPVANFAVAAGTLVLMEILASILVFRKDRIMWWMEGRPGILLKNGTPNRETMHHEKLNDQEVSCLLRLEGLEKEKWRQTKIVTIEADGEPAVLMIAAMKAAQKSDKKSLRKKTND